MKIDTFRIIEFISLFLFGFVGYLYTIWKWTDKNSGSTVLYGIIFLLVIGIIPVLIKTYKEWLKEKKNGGG